VRAQGPATPPPPPPQPTVIPLDGYEQAASSANAQAQAAGGKLAQAQAEYMQAQALVTQANAKLAEAKQARDRQLLEQSVTLATQAKDLADQSAAKVLAAEKLMGDAQAQISDQSAQNVALVSDLKMLRGQLSSTTDQLAAAQDTAADLRGQIRRTDQQVNTLMIMLSLSLIVAAVMAVVLIIRTRQAHNLLQVIANVQTPSTAPAPSAPPAAGPVVDERGTLLYEEPEVDEELSLMLSNVFRPSTSPNGA
jgi:chromosome segregation ATPase